jgi:DNA-binding GntR family transcriptional regulator
MSDTPGTPLVEQTPNPPVDDRVTVQEWVYRQLKERILTGQFVPGHSVTLRGIASLLDVSPMPVREAIRRLVSERALEIQGNRRVSVPRMNRERLDSLCAAREALESLAAEKAILQIDAEQLEALRRLDGEINAAVDEEDIATYMQKHCEFHFAIYRAGGGREILMPLIESIWLQFSPFLRVVIRHIGTEHVVDLDRHSLVLDAIERRDFRTLRFAIEADVREGLGALAGIDWESFEASQRDAGTLIRD